MTTNLFEVKKGKKDSVKDFILGKFSRRSEIMNDLYRSWMLNLAWYRGYQNTDFDSTTRKFITSNINQPWRTRLVANLMLPIARRNVSQLVHTASVWDVIPATTDEEDIQISRISTKVLLYYWQKLGMPKNLIRIAFWQSICSSAYFKVGWDASKGDEISVQTKDLEEELLTRFMEIMGFTSIPETVIINEGDAFFEIVPPFNVIFDENVAIIEESLWSLESQLRTKDWVMDQYGNKWEKLTETSEQELFLYPYIQGERTGRLPKKGILVHELFIKKSKRFKNGLHCVVAGGEIVKSPADHPYEHGELPYAHFLEIYDPASFHGTNAIEQIRPQQARYNRVSSGILENINLQSNIQWLVPRQSGIKQLTNKPGAVWRYNSPFKPEQTQPKPIPAYIDNFLNRTRLDIQDTSSSHDVSEAKAEPGIRSGRAVLALQDADDAVKGPVLLWFDQALATSGVLLLKTLVQFIQEDRLGEIQGDFNEIETITFTGSSLRGKSRGDYFKVRVRTYGRQPMSRSAREALAKTLIDLQLLNPTTNKEELLHILGAADVLSIYDKNASDRIRQWNEIQTIIKGEQDVSVYFGQNHDVHLFAIKKFISSSHWDKLEPEIKEKISEHLRRHLEQQVIEVIYQQAFARGLLGDQNGPARGQQGTVGQQGTAGQQGTGTNDKDRSTRQTEAATR